MRNLSLHPLWHTVMPAYQHGVGVFTHSISALALYLMVTRTPKEGRDLGRYLIVLQISITLVDLNFGHLSSPLNLFPIPGGLCYGVLCTIFGFSGHIGITLTFFTVGYVSVSIICCFHYKFITIFELAKHRTISLKYRCTFRVAIFIIYSVPGFIHMGMYRNLEGGPEFVRKNYASLYYLFENTKYHVFVYDLTIYPAYTMLYACSSIFTIMLAALICPYFVFGTFFLLSKQVTTISEKTRKLQRKLMWLLLVQILVPLTIQCAPLVVNAYSMSANDLTPDINNAVFCFQMTHAFAHTTILIATTPSYREPILFWRRLHNKVAVASINTTSVKQINVTTIV